HVESEAVDPEPFGGPQVVTRARDAQVTGRPRLHDSIIARDPEHAAPWHDRGDGTGAGGCGRRNSDAGPDLESVVALRAVAAPPRGDRGDAGRGRPRRMRTAGGMAG